MRLRRAISRALVGLILLASLSGCTPEGWINVYWLPGAEQATAKRIATCESGLNASAVSPGGGNHGLFQINSVHRRSFEQVTGQPWSAVYDAGYNAMFAHWLWSQQGWRPWSCA